MTDTLKQKLKNTYEKTKQRCGACLEWCVDHPTLAVAIGSAICGGARKAYKIHTERKHATTIYDPRNGMYVTIKRPLSTSQKIELDRRRTDGESIVKVLSDMRMLK